MFQNELTIYRFQYGYGQKLLGDISDAQFQSSPFPGGNPPSWIVGHLAIAADFVLRVLGKPTLLPKNWMVMFGPGSDPMKYLDKHPSREQLTAAYHQGHEAVFTAMQTAQADQLSGPNPFEPLLKPLPTAKDLLVHLLTSHEAFHISQLSACRRAGGSSPYF